MSGVANATVTTSGGSSSAAATVAAVAGVAVDKRNLLSHLGCRVTLDLDDRSSVTGRLVSLGPTGNVILTDAEREWRAARKRTRARTDSTDAPHSSPSRPASRVRRECYTSVLFVRGSSVVAVRYSSGITSDRAVVDTIGSKEVQATRSVQLANLSPAVPLH